MTTYTTHQLAHSIAHTLDQKYHNTSLAIQYAWWMLEVVSEQTKTRLLSQHTIVLSSQQVAQLNQWTHQQVNDHIPLQYLIGSLPFGDCTIGVEAPILIPRPETEEWCMALINKLKKLQNQSFSILDIGTGSGCIAIALAHAFPLATVYAIDISSHALALAQKNAARNNVINITFITSDLFEKLPHNIQFDLIVANPPYISEEEWPTLDASVRIWEDKKALIAPHNGTQTLHRIIKNAPSYLKPLQAPFHVHHIPQLLVEIGYQQGATIAALFSAAGFSPRIEKDLQGNDRIVTGYMHNEVHPIT